MIVYLHNQYVAGSASANAKLNAAIQPWYYRKAPFHRKIPDSQIQHVVVNDRMSVGQVVAAAKTAAKRPGNLSQLLVNTHGNAGSIDLGTGLTPLTVGDFAQLKPYMKPDGPGILLGTCGAASQKKLDPSMYRGLQGALRCRSSATNGLTLLMMMARLTGVPVRGGLDAQLTWNLNGPVVVALPDGRILVTQGRVADSIRARKAA